MIEIIGIVAGFALLAGLVAACSTRDEVRVAERLERFVRRERRV